MGVAASQQPMIMRREGVSYPPVYICSRIFHVFKLELQIILMEAKNVPKKLWTWFEQGGGGGSHPQGTIFEVGFAVFWVQMSNVSPINTGSHTKNHKRCGFSRGPKKIFDTNKLSAFQTMLIPTGQSTNRQTDQPKSSQNR